MNEYRSADWKAFRNEVIRLDNYACTQCGKRAADGAVLHVHHKRYIQGRKPWDYPHNLCSTLCAGCHAVEHGHIPPQHGWTLVGTDDLGDLIGECERCGTALRHSYFVVHPKWRAMEVGTDCCDELTGTPVASEHRKYLDRRKRFVASPRWKFDYRQELSIEQNKISVSLVLSAGTYRLRVYGKLGKKVFANEVDAKAAAFDLLESGTLGAWVKRQQAAHHR
jgi:ribosomal protein S27AE